MALRKSRSLASLAVVSSAVAVLSMLGGAAKADYAPASGDVVGVGSDTVQNIMDFVADGAPGLPGYNAAGNKYKLVSIDATPDANDRAGYLNGSANGSLKQLYPTVVLRGGEHPIQRPNGSSAGIAALLADWSGSTSDPECAGNPVPSTCQNEIINFARSSRQVKSTEFGTAETEGFGGLHVVQISDDPLQIAVNGTPAANGTASFPNSSTNAVPLSCLDLYDIYVSTASTHITTWNQVAGAPSTDTDAIIPLIPQSGSGTRSTFLTDITGCALGSTNATSTPSLNSDVVTVEENDPTAIGQQSTPADAIDPFSYGRLNLFNSGYFTTPGSTNIFNPYCVTGGAVGTAPSPTNTCPPATPTIQLLAGFTCTESAPTSGLVVPSSLPTCASGQIDGTTVSGVTYSSSTATVVCADGATTCSAASAGSGTSSPSVYDDVRGLFVVFRGVDDTDAPWQPGASQNWAEALFSTLDNNEAATGTESNVYVDKSAGLSLIKAAGCVPDYDDLGVTT